MVVVDFRKWNFFGLKIEFSLTAVIIEKIGGLHFPSFLEA